MTYDKDLLYYIKKGDIKKIIKLLKDYGINNVDHNAKILTQAIIDQQTDIVKLLLNNKHFNPNKYNKKLNSSPLVMAIKYGNPKIVYLLMNHKQIIITDNKHETNNVIMLALVYGYFYIVDKALKEKKVTVAKLWKDLQFGENEKHMLKIYKYLVSCKKSDPNVNKNVLDSMIESNAIKTIKYILNNYKLSKKTKNTALKVANKYNRKKIIKLIEQN
jgi:hypothetical protein